MPDKKEFKPDYRQSSGNFVNTGQPSPATKTPTLDFARPVGDSKHIMKLNPLGNLIVNAARDNDENMLEIYKGRIKAVTPKLQELETELNDLPADPWKRLSSRTSGSASRPSHQKENPHKEGFIFGGASGQNFEHPRPAECL